MLSSSTSFCPQENKPTPSPLALLAATCSKIGPTSSTADPSATPPAGGVSASTATVVMTSTPTSVKGLPVAGVATSGPQVVSVPVGLPQQISQQLLQQQGATAAQIVSAAAAAGQNLTYNVMQPMQTVTVDGQEALFIPAMSLAAG